MKRTTVTSSTTDKSITMPAKFAEGLSQTALDTLVSDAYNTHPLSASVVRALNIERARADHTDRIERAHRDALRIAERTRWHTPGGRCGCSATCC